MFDGGIMLLFALQHHPTLFFVSNREMMRSKFYP
jgi:hypothetical protein